MKTFLLFSMLLAGLLGPQIHGPRVDAAVPSNRTIYYVDSCSTRPDYDSLGDLIAAAGYTGENVFYKIQSGEFKLKPNRILFFGSYCTDDPKVRNFLKQKESELQDLVRRGGCVVFFAQGVKARKNETWLIPGMSLLRGDGEYDLLNYLDRKHPLFSHPNAISHRRLNQDWKSGPTARQAFRVVSRGRILAARDERGRDPFCVEFGWGRGRVVFFACKPEMEKRRLPETKRLAQDLVENALAYAVDVVRGRAAHLPDHAIVTEKSVGYKPKRIEDSKKSDHTFEMEINAAVDRGVAHLVSKQLKDGSFGRYGQHEAGPTALTVTALLGTGINKYTPYIKKGIDFVLDNPPSRYTTYTYTYDVGLSMMAIDAWTAPMYERFELEKLHPSKREHFKFQRDLSKEERNFMVRCRDWLVSVQSESGYWSYSADPSPRSGDLSNTQFAVLGLRSAVRCGLEVPPKTWTRLIEALLSSQESTGPRISMPDFRNFSSTSGKPDFYIAYVRARTWGYRPETSTGRGSHCAMGISTLLLANEGLSLKDRGTASKYSGSVRKAVKSGLAFLWSQWSVSENPNAGKSHLYYYLYALERVGVLTGRRFIGDRDWYREGAVFLLEKQGENGAWERSDISTCFALMFLKRSTPPPVITISK